MIESEVSKNKIREIEIKGKKVYLQFYFDEALLSNKQSSLLFYLRNNNRAIYFSFRQISSLDGIGLYETVINLDEAYQEFIHKSIWDVYVLVDNKKKYRLNCSEHAMGLLHYFFEKENLVFYPYMTKKGDLSFKISRPFLFAGIEKALLRKNGTIYVSGFCYFPQKSMHSSVKIQKSLVIENEANGIKHRVPVEDNERKDFKDLYNLKDEKIGFETVVNLNNYIQTDKTIHFSFYFEVSFQDKDGIIQHVSPRLTYHTKVIQLNHQSRISKFLKSKKKIILFATKHKKYLAVTVSTYYSNEEIYERVRKIFMRWKRVNKIVAIYRVLFQLVGLFPATKKTIVFESYLGKQYSCNPRAIFEYIKKNYPEFKMYWSVDPRFHENFQGKNLEIIPRFSIKWLFVMAKAEYWVSNSRLPLWIPKPKHTTYLQTWHGTPLKKLAADMNEVHMPGTNTEMYKKNFLYEARNWDYLVSPNAYSSKIFRSAFQFKKNIIESGYPRNDILFQDMTEGNQYELKSKFDIPLNKKVILYAPTWRDDQFYQRGKYKFNLELDLNKLRDAIGDEYVVLLRMHYLVAENFDLSPYKGFAYDFSNYEDIRELYIISDLLITDYSSVFFDYGNLKRPIIFYVYDIETYRDKLRGFYFDFENTAPGPLAKTTEEVIEWIKTGQEEVFSSKFKAFYDKFCYLEDGHAASRVVKEVFLK